MTRKPYPCDSVVSIEQEPHHHLVIANNFARAFAVEIAAHDRTLCHHHEHEYLMYAVGDAQIVSAPRDSGPKIHNYRDGDCELSPPGLVHVVENLQSTKFRNLLVELLRLPEGSPTFSSAIGEWAGGTSGHTDTSTLFADGRVSVLLLEMESDAEVEFSGPAIVASPYENEVEITLAQKARTLVEFTDLAWIDPETQASLRNKSTHSAKVVLIALGRK